MRTVSLTLLCASLAAASAARAAPYFTGLGDLPGGIAYSDARGVSNGGFVVVGTSISANGQEGYRWTQASGMTSLREPNDVSSWGSTAYDVSSDGSVVVGHGSSTGRLEAYRWTQESGRVQLGVIPGGSLSVATGVSADGSVVVGVGNSEAFRWSADTGMVGLGDLPPNGPFASQANGISADGQVIAGQGYSASGFEAFLWTELSGLQPLGDLPGGLFSSSALGVSSNGSVVVGTGESNLGEQAFRWTAGGMLALPLLPSGAVPTQAFAVSGDGSIVVGSSRYAGIAFIWDAAHGTRSLQDVLANDYGLDLTGWTLEDARGISADGRAIVGVGTNPDGNEEAFLASVPEPSIGLLLGTGLAALALSATRPARIGADSRTSRS